MISQVMNRRNITPLYPHTVFILMSRITHVTPKGKKTEKGEVILITTIDFVHH